MIVLVTGGREFATSCPNERAVVAKTLNGIDGVSIVIHGRATGADEAADAWATSRGKPCLRCPANWDRHGRGAGPRRNAEMLAFALAAAKRRGVPEPVMLVAFPGGPRHCKHVPAVRRSGARAQGGQGQDGGRLRVGGGGVSQLAFAVALEAAYQCYRGRAVHKGRGPCVSSLWIEWSMRSPHVHSQQLQMALLRALEKVINTRPAYMALCWNHGAPGHKARYAGTVGR